MNTGKDLQEVPYMEHMSTFFFDSFGTLKMGTVMDARQRMSATLSIS